MAVKVWCDTCGAEERENMRVFQKNRVITLQGEIALDEGMGTVVIPVIMDQDICQNCLFNALLRAKLKEYNP